MVAGLYVEGVMSLALVPDTRPSSNEVVEALTVSLAQRFPESLFAGSIYIFERGALLSGCVPASMSSVYGISPTGRHILYKVGAEPRPTRLIARGVCLRDSRELLILDDERVLYRAPLSVPLLKEWSERITRLVEQYLSTI
jgi:hypothetical protein